MSATGWREWWTSVGMDLASHGRTVGEGLNMESHEAAYAAGEAAGAGRERAELDALKAAEWAGPWEPDRGGVYEPCVRRRRPGAPDVAMVGRTVSGVWHTYCALRPHGQWHRDTAGLEAGQAEIDAELRAEGWYIATPDRDPAEGKGDR